MATGREMVFVGVKGTVTALDRDSGERVWETALKGSDFVNVMLQGSDLFAASRGRLYRLDPANGGILWLNELPGMGYGIVTIAGAPQSAPSAEKHRRDQAAAAAVVVAGS